MRTRTLCGMDTGTQEPAQHRVRLESQGINHRLFVDDRDVTEESRVRAVSIEVAPSYPAVITLEVLQMTPAVLFDGDATIIVRTPAQDQPSDFGPDVERFLSALDPQTLSADALARLDFGTGPHAVVEAVLRTLADYAQGRDPRPAQGDTHDGS